MNTRHTRIFPGEFSSLSAVYEFVAKAAQAAGLDDRATYAIQMAVDEACSNIIEHAYEGQGAGDIRCTYEITPGSLTVTLCDNGERFDPTHASEPDLGAELKDRTRGGLGIYFIRKLVDQVEYKYSPDCGNTLKLVKRREAES
jgi:serine/threonine-protein kinase RsbW